jgi:hypothetical protein
LYVGVKICYSRLSKDYHMGVQPVKDTTELYLVASSMLCWDRIIVAKMQLTGVGYE